MYWAQDLLKEQCRIAGAIVCREGNGPLAGTALRLNRSVLSDDPEATDATCASVTGFLPERVPYTGERAKFVGNGASERIDQLASPVTFPIVPFATIQEFDWLRVRRSSPS